jgi:hypothetical protein
MRLQLVEAAMSKVGMVAMICDRIARICGNAPRTVVTAVGMSRLTFASSSLGTARKRYRVLAVA